MTPAHNSDKSPEFIKKQYQFASHLRDPEHTPCPDDIEDRRMKIYRELFYNNVEDFMAHSFPVLRDLINDDHWHAMIRDYFAQHIAHTPLFHEMPREFLKYLESERKPQPEDPPFMLELAHYEWVELALTISDIDIDVAHIDPQGNLLDGRPMLSPLAWPLSYQFDVHRINLDYQPDTPPDTPTYIVVYRTQEDTVNFLELNPVTAHLLQLISEDNNLTGREMLTTIADAIQHPEPDTVIEGGLEIMNDLRDRGVLLGVKRP